MKRFNTDKRKRSSRAGYYTKSEKETFMKEFYQFYDDPSILTEDELWEIGSELIRLGEEDLGDKYCELSAEMYHNRAKQEPYQRIGKCCLCGCNKTLDSAYSDRITLNNGYRAGWVCDECFNQIWEEVGND